MVTAFKLMVDAVTVMLVRAVVPPVAPLNVTEPVPASIVRL